MSGIDDKGEPNVPSSALVTICLAAARCCSIMCSAKSNAASRTSSGMPGAAVVDAGCWPRCLHQLRAPVVPLLPQLHEVLLCPAGEFGELLLGTGSWRCSSA
jgi:hypothetical protein